MALVDKNISAENAAWSFDNIAGEFDQHVLRSVPLYNEGHELVCQLSDFFLGDTGHVTELGVSTGVLAERFLKHNAARTKISYTGVDRFATMIDRAAQRLKNDPRAKFAVAEIGAMEIQSSAMVISYYTMQFVPPAVRQDVYNRIYNALEWGGALLLFEKVRAPDARFQDIISQTYLEYKLTNNFNEAEILQKQRSLKGVLEPFSTQGNIDLLRRAGFVDVMTVMKYLCFEGFLAIK